MQSPENNERMNSKLKKSQESMDSYRRDVLMKSSSKKQVLLPNFQSPPSSQRKQSPSYSEYRRRVNFVKNLSPKTLKKEFLSPMLRSSARNSGSQNLDLAAIETNSHFNNMDNNEEGGFEKINRQS